MTITLGWRTYTLCAIREITYSQGLVVEDPVLLATLCIFCGTVWLPYDRVGDAIQDVLTRRSRRLRRLFEDLIPPWLGDVNVKWVERNMKAKKAFKCMSSVDRKLEKLTH